MSLAQVAVLLGKSLPSTACGGRFAGDPAKLERPVAVCGGAGGSLLDAATAAGADAYVTSDLRHHVVSEHLADGGCAVIDMPHWATEWPWLETAAAELHAGLAASGTTVNTKVSVLPTDPWGGRIDSPSRKEPR
jgi:putative NIF3 family GTP cyclohydrolase 1 type 2